MKRCVIVTAYPKRASLLRSVALLPDDFIVCADGGYQLADAAGIRPNVLIGDFDSWTGDEAPDCEEIYRVPRQKDDTDTMLCVKYALQNGYREIVIVGGIGGRFDHTMANLNALAYGLDHGASVAMVDEHNLAVMLENGEMEIRRKTGCKLSLVAYSDQCFRVSISGVEYPLKNALLCNCYPIGISNEFTEDCAHLSCGKGKLLVLLSRD